MSLSPLSPLEIRMSSAEVWSIGSAVRAFEIPMRPSGVPAIRLFEVRGRRLTARATAWCVALTWWDPSARGVRGGPCRRVHQAAACAI